MTWAYAGHICDTEMGKRGHIPSIFQAYVAYAWNMLGICLGNMPGIFPGCAQYMPNFIHWVNREDLHHPGICPAYAASPI